MGNNKYDDWVIIERLGDIVLQNVKGCIVEIGMGASTEVLANLAKLHDRKQYECDTSTRKCEWASNSEKVKHDKLFIYNEKSFKFIENFDDVPALVFIDGNHYYKYVKKETDFFIPRLAPGGIMFLHDTFIHRRYYERYERKGKKTEAYKVRQELEKDPRVWCMTFPYTASYCGLTVVLKKQDERPFYQF